MIEEIEEVVKVEGPDKDINPYLESMLNHWRNNRGNLFSWLRSLSEPDLLGLSVYTDEEEKRDKRWSKIAAALAIMAHSIEKWRDEKQFKASIDDLCHSGYALSATCDFVMLEKKGLIKVTDDSYFFDKDGKVSVQPTEKFRSFFEGSRFFKEV